MEDRSDDERLERLAALAEVFCEEVRDGRTSVEEYARRYPELAEEIREYFPSLEMLEVVGKRYSAADGGADSISAQVTRRFGPETDPHITLNDKEEAHADFVSSVLGRIADRQGSHRYDLRGEVGRGGQGAVLVVWDEDLRRNLAMKVVLGETDDDGHETPVDSRTLGRFLEEAQVTGQLDHPGIVPVHELGLDDEGRAYFTMKLVKGRDLRSIFQLVRDGGEDWTLTRALNVMLKVCEALAYAHSKLVIHRDLKPSNVMVGKFGEVYVMDWGLARVLGAEDRKDIRIQPDVSEEIRSPRHDPSDNGDASLVTLEGDVVGTPAYMSPEQARGDLEAMGAHSDVYSVGAMLYQLLTGRVPYIPENARLSNRAVWAMVQGGPPEPVFKLAPNVPPELVAICEKAMARSIAARYRDTSELADDLRAFLENRVVSAYRTGALIELRKWIERNKLLAASIAAVFLAVVAGLAASVVLKNRSAAYAKEASETAVREKQRVEEVMRLSAYQDLEELRREADKLWPPRPEMAKRYKDWLGKAQGLVAGLDPDPNTGDIGHRARLAELEGRALLYTEEQREADLRSHPSFQALEIEKGRIEAWKRNLAVREGRADVEEVELDVDSLPTDARKLADLGYVFLDGNRTIFGKEAEGLAMTRLALEYVEDDYTYVRVTKALAQALMINGLVDEAMAEMELALDVLPDPHPHRAELESAAAKAKAYPLEWPVERLRTWIAHQEEEHMNKLEADISASVERQWDFEEEGDRWWHAQLRMLVEELEALDDPETGLFAGVSVEHGWGITRRLAFAESVEDRTLSSEEARALWSEGIASISDPDECPSYEGLMFEPQRGLLPIGRDPRSLLWEFAHVLSGDPAHRNEQGELVLTEDTGIVLVLLPGGDFWMGAQSEQPLGINYDPGSPEWESPVHRVELTPFFISKYEITQGQWLRFSGDNPSSQSPEAWSLAWNANGLPGTLLHPVEGVDWFAARRISERMMLELPSEAQWEYAARGGTSSVWSTGDVRESLIGSANLADRYADKVNAGWDWAEDWLDDGHSGHSPVGKFEPNPFGLHDVHGNIWEWCLDGWDPRFYGRSAYLDPLRVPEGTTHRIMRGGGHEDLASAARSAFRSAQWPKSHYVLGFRPVRVIEGKIRYRD